MVVLIDANIVLDYLLRREPFYSDAKNVLKLCSSDCADGCIAVHTVTTIWYLMRKIPENQRRTALRSICEILQVAGTSHDEIIKAIDEVDFKDFEDCVQTKCALSFGAEYIVTRNKDDFISSKVPVISPGEFISLFLNDSDEQSDKG